MDNNKSSEKSNKKRWLPLAEVAERLCIKAKTPATRIPGLLADGCPLFKYCGSWYIDADDLDRWMDQMKRRAMKNN